MKTTGTVYDLEERTFLFAKNVRMFIKKLPISTSNIEDGKQVIKSSGSIGANYHNDPKEEIPKIKQPAGLRNSMQEFNDQKIYCENRISDILKLELGFQISN